MIKQVLSVSEMNLKVINHRINHAWAGRFIDDEPAINRFNERLEPGTKIYWTAVMGNVSFYIDNVKDVNEDIPTFKLSMPHT